MKNTWRWILGGGVVAVIVVAVVLANPQFQKGYFDLKSEDTNEDSTIQSRWLLKDIKLHPRLLQNTDDSTNTFLKFSLKIQYQGADYDFSDLMANNVASLACDFGVNARTGDSVYRDQEDFVYAGELPLINNQEISTDLVVTLPVRHRTLLRRNNNFCFVQLNNVIDGEDLSEAERDAIIDGVVRDSVPFHYKVKMIRGRLRLTPL